MERTMRVGGGGCGGGVGCVFFFNDTATTEIYTLSLHDALPISPDTVQSFTICGQRIAVFRGSDGQVRALDAYCPHKIGRAHV